MRKGKIQDAPQDKKFRALSKYARNLTKLASEKELDHGQVTISAVPWVFLSKSWM
jgi:ATP-dependent Clp protease ATP-binding subunit ClpA